tara:strand:+ start:21903 stop:22427 length:525 start_codon:yes stop_codon:yes gene_type:complete
LKKYLYLDLLFKEEDLGKMTSGGLSAHINFMEIALQEARRSADRGEVPVGCVIVDWRSKTIVASEGNRVEEWKDPTAHAEMVAIKSATEIIREKRLGTCDLYVNLEPCPMCAAAISFARIRRLYFGALDHKSGGVENGARIFDQKTCHHRPEVYGGIREVDAAKLLKSFFAKRR